jgi:RNA polymerase sigma factor for flagellar operon FliA
MAVTHKKVWDDYWDQFWPIRADVRLALEQGREVDEATSQKWQDMRNHLVAKYYYLVQRGAEKLATKITEVQADALASMGVDGLYDAVDGYGAIHPVTDKWAGIDPETGKPVKFETFAAYRIKGSMIDEIRRDDWVPRLVRSRAKTLKEKTAALTALLGRIPTEEEMASYLELSLEDYSELADSSTIKTVQSFNTTVSNATEHFSTAKDMAIIDMLCDRKTPKPWERLLGEELKAKLFGVGFTPLERRIITQYYFEGRAMKEISKSIGLSESRVSQMNTDIIKRLQEKVRRNPEYFGNQTFETLRK